MMVHVDESFSFHTSRNSYVNFDLISFPDLTLPTETNIPDIPENLKKIIRVKASRPLVCIIKQRSAWEGREEGRGGMKMNESLDYKVFDCLLSLESQLDANIA